VILEKKDQQHALILLYFEQLPSINYRFFFFPTIKSIVHSLQTSVINSNIYEKEKMDAQISFLYTSIEKQRSSNMDIFFSSGVRTSNVHVGDNICSIRILKKIDGHYIHKDIEA
jgi:hypothetical protein